MSPIPQRDRGHDSLVRMRLGAHLQELARRTSSPGPGTGHRSGGCWCEGVSMPFNSTEYRAALRHYPSGVVVVTGLVDGEPIGMVIGTFSSVSLDPPLVSFMPARASTTWMALRRANSFCVNVLAHDQEDLSRAMAHRAVVRKFDGVPWTRSTINGEPVLDGAVLEVACRQVNLHELGDHLLVLCAVDGLEVHRSVPPLIHLHGQYSSCGVGDAATSALLGSVAR